MAPVTEITADNCKRHRPRNLLVMIITACGVLAWTGCHQMTHRQQQAEAEHHWKQVRGKVKCQLARQQFEGGHVDDAITTAREALGLDPASPESYVLLCRALLDKGDLAAARQVLGMAEELGLESAELSYMRGLISERSRNLTDALESYRRAGELEPGQRDYLAAEAECLVALGRVEEALDRVRDAHSRFDRDGTLDVLEAEIAMLLDRREEAVESFRRAMPLLGDNDVVAEEYGLLLVRTGHFAEAVSVLQPLRERAGDEAPGLVIRSLARCYLELGQLDTTETMLRSWLRDHHDDAQAWLVRAQAAIARGDLLAARGCTAQVRRLGPGHAQTHLLDGYVCWRQGELQDALSNLEQFLTSQPDDAIAHCLMGQVLADGGKYEQARHHWQLALQIDPRAHWARAGLGTLSDDDAPPPAPVLANRSAAVVTNR